jgi:hypothetical protein
VRQPIEPLETFPHLHQDFLPEILPRVWRSVAPRNSHPTRVIAVKQLSIKIFLLAQERRPWVSTAIGCAIRRNVTANLPILTVEDLGFLLGREVWQLHGGRWYDPWMATASLPPTEAMILERVIQEAFADLSGEFARRLTRMQLPADDLDRLHALGAKARAGSLTPDEDAELEAYLRIGHMLNILKLRARTDLRRANKKSPDGRKPNGRKP